MSAPIHRPFWAAFGSALLFFAAFYTLIVPMPLYLADIGLPDWQIGFIMGAFGIASLIGRPLAGALCDSIGVRPVIVFGVLALAVGGVVVMWATHPWLLFGLRILQAAGYVAFTTASTALVSDLVSDETRGSALARFGAAANVAITIIPAVVTSALPWLTLRGAFALCGGFAVVAGALIWRAIPRRPGTGHAWSFGQLLTFPRILWMPMITTALFGVGFGAYFQYLPLLAERRDLAPLGIAYTVYGIAIIATRLLTGRLLDRIDRRRLLIPAAIVMASGLWCFAGATSLPLLLVAAALTATGGGVFHPALIAIHIDSIPERGKATAAVYLAFDLGIGAGAWVLAPILEVAGIGPMYVVAGVITLLAGLVSPWIARRDVSQSSA